MQILAPAPSNETKHLARDYLRLAIAKAVVGRGGDEAVDYFRSRWGRSINLGIVEKAAHAPQRKSVVPVGTFNDTGGDTWGAELAAERVLADAFGEVLRPRTVIDRLSAVRRVPFNVKVPLQTAGGTARWTAEGAAYMASAPSYTGVSLPPAKIGGVMIASDELVKLSDPSAESLIRRDLEATAIAFCDDAFLNPSYGGVAGQQSGAITNGLSPIESSGTTKAAARADFRALFDAVDGTLEGAALVMRRTTAVALASLGDDFATVTALGGSLWGVPILVSDSAPVDANSPAEDTVTLLDSSEMLLADAGIEIATFREGDVELNDSPDSPTTASTSLTSLWMHNLVAFRMTRFVAWKPRRSNMVAMLVGARYAE
jgi:HK97 family phage major capsid protein